MCAEGVRVTIPEKKLQEILRGVADFVRRDYMLKRHARSLLGKLSFVAGLAPALRLHVRALWG
eukprot:1509194-Alexandrium_andersonii.AAC.1